MEIDMTVNEMIGKIDEEQEIVRSAGRTEGAERAEDADDGFIERYAASKKPVSEIRAEAKRRGVTGTQIAMELKEAGLSVPKFYSDEMIEARKVYGKRGADKVHGAAADKPKVTEPVKGDKPKVKEKTAEDVIPEAEKEPEKVPTTIRERMTEETKMTACWAISEELRKLLHERDEAQDRIRYIDQMIDKLNRAFKEMERA